MRSLRPAVSKRKSQSTTLKLCSFYFLFLSVFALLLAIIINKKPSKLFPVKNKKFKYILEWAYSITNCGYFSPLWLHKGQQLFIHRKCSVQDCYITSDRSLFGDITKFDAILFHSQFVMHLNYLPPKRSPHQKYIFASIEPSEHTKYWKYDFKDFYNWTLTYKLDSDVLLPYLIIRDKQWNIIGPSKEMQWKDSVEIKKTVLDDNVRAKLQNKSKAVAWFVSYCQSPGKRENFVEKLQNELKRYNLSVDIYGNCSKLKCPANKDNECLQMLTRDYFFYLSFENSICEDYASEKLIRPLRHYVVPVVYGGANYTRFMPDGFYLDARKLGAAELARQMNELMQNPERYYQYFKWHNFYSYHTPEEYADSDPFCRLCAKLNDEKSMKETKVYNNFIQWWNSDQVVTKTETRLVNGHIL